MKMVFLYHRFLNHSNLYPPAIVLFRSLPLDDYRQHHFKTHAQVPCREQGQVSVLPSRWLIYCPTFDGSPWLEVCDLRKASYWQPGFYTGMGCLHFTCFPLLLSPPFLLAASIPFLAAFSILILNKRDEWLIVLVLKMSQEPLFWRALRVGECWMWFNQIYIFMFIKVRKCF